ncbi:hypothetical protein [Zobellella maritima]|uniref:hypothetical protein n=1 Tax=Zobellella maritima TaxID=2059725 RepID=UPI0038CD684F
MGRREHRDKNHGFAAQKIQEVITRALGDEVAALDNAGEGIIQIDEPACRELMPLRNSKQAAYLEWAEKVFRSSAAGVSDATRIHTCMCYSEFNEIIESIARLDADVMTIETSRADMELLDVFRDFAYPNEIGPGVYDIHSPRIPTVAEMVTLIKKAVERLPKERIWVNPDSGLKTRTGKKPVKPWPTGCPLRRYCARPMPSSGCKE